MRELPADPTLTATAVAVSAMANTADSPDLLRIQVQAIAWPLVLVALHRWLGIEPREPLEPDTSEDG